MANLGRRISDLEKASIEPVGKLPAEELDLIERKTANLCDALSAGNIRPLQAEVKRLRAARKIRDAMLAGVSNEAA